MALSPETRERVFQCISTFQTALEADSVATEPAAGQCVAEAADLLMRAIARVLLEVGPPTTSDPPEVEHVEC